MAADLSIHIFEGVTEHDLRVFFASTMGSKHFNLAVAMNHEAWQAAYVKVSETPQIWIGEVSWLKAAVFDNQEDFVPGPVQQIHTLIGEDLPVLDGKLLETILGALEEENATEYRVAKPAEVNGFLEAHLGKKLFTVSW